MITSLTTLMVVVVLLLKGGATLHDFALVLTVGIIVGTYSSVFVASPIYIFFYKNMPKMRKMLSKG